MTVLQHLPGISSHTGFPNAATDESLQAIDLNKILIQHRVSTYFMRARGNTWERLGILAGDVVLIDKALSPRHNDVVVWHQEDAFQITPFHELPEGAQVWGVVSSIIHCLREPS